MKNGKLLGLVMMSVGLLGGCGQLAEEVEVTGNDIKEVPYEESRCVYLDSHYDYDERTYVCKDYGRMVQVELEVNLDNYKEQEWIMYPNMEELARQYGIDLAIEEPVRVVFTDGDEYVLIETNRNGTVDYVEISEGLNTDESEVDVEEEVVGELESIDAEVYEYIDDPTMLTWPFTDNGVSTCVFVNEGVVHVTVFATSEGFEWVGETLLARGVNYIIHFEDGVAYENLYEDVVIEDPSFTEMGGYDVYWPGTGPNYVGRIEYTFIEDVLVVVTQGDGHIAVGDLMAMLGWQGRLLMVTPDLASSFTREEDFNEWVKDFIEDGGNHNSGNIALSGYELVQIY